MSLQVGFVLAMFAALASALPNPHGQADQQPKQTDFLTAPQGQKLYPYNPFIAKDNDISHEVNECVVQGTTYLCVYGDESYFGFYNVDFGTSGPKEIYIEVAGTVPLQVTFYLDDPKVGIKLFSVSLPSSSTLEIVDRVYANVTINPPIQGTHDLYLTIDDNSYGYVPPLCLFGYIQFYEL